MDKVLDSGADVEQISAACGLESLVGHALDGYNIGLITLGVGCRSNRSFFSSSMSLFRKAATFLQPLFARDVCVLVGMLGVTDSKCIDLLTSNVFADVSDFKSICRQVSSFEDLMLMYKG